MNAIGETNLCYKNFCVSKNIIFMHLYIYKLSISNLYICWLYIPGLCKKGCQSDGGAIGQSRNGFQHHCGKMVLVLMGAVDMYQIWKV